MIRILESFLISLFFLPILVMAHTMTDLKQSYRNKGNDYKPRTQHIDEHGRAKFINHLILESSPYLLQHAHNPVNWHAFTDEAFDKATLENKPIFISIGYATCHWCHVMEEESFDDIEVAKFLNKYFIAIKVDREIRPDVDATYMNVSQLLNGTGGWPLNVVTLSDGKAFFAGTYFPKSQLLNILSQIQKLWQHEQNKVISQANEIAKILNKTTISTQTLINSKAISQSIQTMLKNFDDLEGGFGEAPKFPHESMLLLLLDEQKRNPSHDKLNIITITLNTMASGGFYDAIAGGFHRYSTDNAWLIPHFEKMLYNQAQLSLVYTRAYQLTQNPLYKRIAKQTLDYVLREMHSIDGGFYSATDADSEGTEGTYFIWSVDELKSIFADHEFKRFEKWFDLSAYTDFEGSHVIRYKNINNIQKDNYNQIDKLLTKLYKIRSKRVPPLTDNKVLLSWNSLMIPSFVEAGEVFDEDKYTKAALQLSHYIHSHFNIDNQLYRVSINNNIETRALFEDYAYLANAYLSVFDKTNDQNWLNRAILLLKTMNDKFWDKKQFGFNMTSKQKYLNSNYKESYDGAIPSSNAVAYQVLVKLFNRTGNKEFIEQAEQLLGAFSNEINQDPYNFSSFFIGFNDATVGELSSVQYAYDGRIRIHTQRLKDNQILINLTMKPDWHVNSNKPLQDYLIATKIVPTDTEIWSIKNSTYPSAELVKLGFSEEKISIYKNQIQIQVDLIGHSTDYTPPKLELSLQACSDTVCLPPTTVTLEP